MTVDELKHIKDIVFCRAPIINDKTRTLLNELIDAEIERQNQEPCEWCYDRFRFEYNKIFDDGSTICIDNIVDTGIANYCPNCGRKL